MNAVFCDACGSENPAAARYCFNCGAPLTRGQPRGVSLPPQFDEAQEESFLAPNRRPSALIGFLREALLLLGSFLMGMGGATYLFGSLLNVFAALVFAYLLWGVFGLLGAIALLPVAMVGVPLLMGLQYGLWQPLLGPLSVYVVAFVVYGVGRLLTGKHEPKEVTMIIGVVLGFIGLCVVWSYLSLLAGAVEIVSPDGTVRPLLTR